MSACHAPNGDSGGVSGGGVGRGAQHAGRRAAAEARGRRMRGCACLHVAREDGGDLLQVEASVDGEEQVVVAVQLVADRERQPVEADELVDAVELAGVARGGGVAAVDHRRDVREDGRVEARAEHLHEDGEDHLRLGVRGQPRGVAERRHRRHAPVGGAHVHHPDAQLVVPRHLLLHCRRRPPRLTRGDHLRPVVGDPRRAARRARPALAAGAPADHEEEAAEPAAAHGPARVRVAHGAPRALRSGLQCAVGSEPNQ